MSAALNINGGESSHSQMTLQDLSLSSLPSLSPSFSTPGRSSRIPSGTTAASSAALNTPSPSISGQKRIGFSRTIDDQDDDVDGVSETPGRFSQNVTGTPGPLSSKRKSAGKGSSNLTLRDQEKHIDALKKENFNIKLKVHFLEERLAQMAPDQINAAMNQNVALKVELQNYAAEMKKQKKLLVEQQREMENLRRGRDRERELEGKVAELERQLRDSRRRKDSMTAGDEELIQRNAELEERVLELQDACDERDLMLQEQGDKIQRLELSGRGAEDLANNARIRDMEADIEELNEQLDERNEIIVMREDECEDAMNKIEELKRYIDALERRREEDVVIERSESRAQILEEREEREAIEHDLNAVRDRLSAKDIELSQKDDEIAQLQSEIQFTDKALQEKEADYDLLRRENEKFMLYIEEKEADIQGLNGDLEELSQRIRELEAEKNHLLNENAQIAEEVDIMRQEHDAKIDAYKEKLNQHRAELEERMEMHRETVEQLHDLQEEKENLARHIETLVSELRAVREKKDKLEIELPAQLDKAESAQRRTKRELEAKDSALQSALNDLARNEALLAERNSDIAELQKALTDKEVESRRLGESHTSDRFSLQLEVDRLRRDMEHLEDDLKRAREELASKDVRNRSHDDEVDKLHAEKRDLLAQLTAQTQAKLNSSEKLDSTQLSLRTAESELAACKQKISELEQKLSKSQRQLLHVETQSREQVAERNQLLLTVYEDMGKVLGAERNAKKPEAKPFTNLSVFNELLMSRLNKLTFISSDFEKKSKELESRHSDKLNELRKQLDQRWRSLDKFESSVKSLQDVKLSWKRKFSAKEGELEGIRTLNTELQAQLSSLRRPAQNEATELRSAQARAANAERRLANAQNQLAAAEEKIASVNQRTTVIDSKWEARVKEYESRLRQAEERVKRERQGAKERVAELETNIKLLHRQIDLANKRSQQLNEVLEVNGLSSAKDTKTK